MGDEYTPTTEHVRDLWCFHFHEGLADDDAKADADWDDDRMYAQFDRWLATHDAEVARQRAEKIVGFLSTPGVLWHGDDGVTVYADGPYGGNRMKLTDWLRAQ